MTLLELLRALNYEWDDKFKCVVQNHGQVSKTIMGNTVTESVKPTEVAWRQIIGSRGWETAVASDRNYPRATDAATAVITREIWEAFSDPFHGMEEL